MRNLRPELLENLSEFGNIISTQPDDCPGNQLQLIITIAPGANCLNFFTVDDAGFMYPDKFSRIQLCLQPF